MTMNTFTPPIKADSASGNEFKVSGIESKFNDGYSQFTPIGINPVLSQLSLKWTNLYHYEATPILNFLKAQLGKSFYYTPNGESSPKAFRCKSWNATWKHGRRCDLTASFEQVAPNS